MSNQTAKIEAGSVFLPRCAPWLQDFRREICEFPVGRYNDQVDAVSQALSRAYRRLSLLPMVFRERGNRTGRAEMLLHPTVHRLRALGLATMADGLTEPTAEQPEAAVMPHADWLGPSSIARSPPETTVASHVA